MKLIYIIISLKKSSEIGFSFRFSNLFLFCFLFSLAIGCKENKKELTAASYEADQADTTFLGNLESPILLAGDEQRAFRDPLLLYGYDKFWLFYSLATNETDSIIQGEAFWQTAYSTSDDLKSWTKPTTITPADLNLNFASPGSIVKQDGEWVLALQTYPTPNGEKFGNDSSRLWTMRSKDLKNWGEAELISFLGPDVPREAMPRMIDPYIMKDKDEPNKWWCFCKIKQTGVSMAWSEDLQTWNYEGRVDGGENVCVVVEDDEYVLFHSPENGIGVKRSSDLRNWADTQLLTLGQNEWSWAQGRITAGYVFDTKDLKINNVGARYIMVFHGEKDENSFTVNSNIGIAWSNDLENWNWPGSDDLSSTSGQ